MFGISFTELLLVAAVALIVVGPQKLPAMLGSLGRWMHKLRRLATEMRQQTGIDEILREEGLQGGLNELRGLVRGGNMGAAVGGARPAARATLDLSREYPPEGADSYGTLADDLVPQVPPVEPQQLVAPNAPIASPNAYEDASSLSSPPADVATGPVGTGSKSS